MRQSYTRRSFLGRVAGTGALMAFGAGAARAQPQEQEQQTEPRWVVDADPSDPARPYEEEVAQYDEATSSDTDRGPGSDKPQGPRNGQRFINCSGPNPNPRCPR